MTAANDNQRFSWLSTWNFYLFIVLQARLWLVWPMRLISSGIIWSLASGARGRKWGMRIRCSLTVPLNLPSAVEFIQFISHVRASVPQLQHSYKLPNCTRLTMKKELVLFLLLSALVVTVYPRPAQVLTNPQMVAAEGERNTVGREWMTGQRANGQSCCPLALCRLSLCPPAVQCC